MRRIVGNVGAFKLPNDEYGFGRIFKYADVAFYSHIGKNEKDCISGEYSIYYANGDIVPSTYEECKNLEVCAVWELSHVIDRLMGDDKWQKCMAL